MSEEIQVSDMDVINAFMRQAATKAVADAIREQTSQLALTSLARPVLTDPSVYQVDNVGRRPRNVEVHPIDGSYSPPQRSGWLGISPVKWVAITLGLSAIVGLIWGLIVIISALVTATVTAVTSVMPVLIGVGLIVLLVMLCSGRGGGGTFSGTFSGRMH